MKSHVVQFRGRMPDVDDEKATSAQRRHRLEGQARANLEDFLDRRLAEYLSEKIASFEGNFDVLESAVGSLIVGQAVGWRVLTLIHSSRTIRKYQETLGLDFKGKLPWDPDSPVMPPEGPLARKSFAYNVALKLGDFWKVVRGQTDEISSASERKTSLPLSD